LYNLVVEDVDVIVKTTLRFEDMDVIVKITLRFEDVDVIVKTASLFEDVNVIGKTASLFEDVDVNVKTTLHFEDVNVIVKTTRRYMLKKRRYGQNLSVKYMDQKQIYSLETLSRMCPELSSRHHVKWILQNLKIICRNLPGKKQKVETNFITVQTFIKSQLRVVRYTTKDILIEDGILQLNFRVQTCCYWKQQN
jgi:hypothetical protein